jgi:hypothetical protein
VNCNCCEGLSDCLTAVLYRVSIRRFLTFAVFAIVANGCAWDAGMLGCWDAGMMVLLSCLVLRMYFEKIRVKGFQNASLAVVYE